MLHKNKNATPSKYRADHRPVILLCLAALLASMVLRLDAQGRLFLPWIDVAMPGVCTLRQMTGYPCPGCGMTRSFVAMGHLDPARAFALHRCGPFLYLYVCLQLGARLLHPRWPGACDRMLASRPMRIFLIALGVGLVANWLANLVLFIR